MDHEIIERRLLDSKVLSTSYKNYTTAKKGRNSIHITRNKILIFTHYSNINTNRSTCD